jgi:deoxyribonuclease-4
MLPKIGAHVSAAGGLYKAVENAQRIGAETIQIFGSSPRAWRGVLPSAENSKKFKLAASAARLGPVYLHASYLVNLASAKDYNREQSILSLIDHLKIAEAIGARGLIFHLGSAGEEPDPEVAAEKTVEAIKGVLRSVSGEAMLIMENSAGGGAKLGHTLSEIGDLFRRAKAKRLGVCFDTAHAFEAGLIERYDRSGISALFDEFDKEIGLKNLLVLHVNDSKTVFNSHHDRHENLGQGLIGLEGFAALAGEKRLHDKDWILEVPGFDGLGPDKKNLDILKKLLIK